MIPEGNYKPIPEYEDYLIYDTGEVWSCKRNKFLKPFQNNTYLKVSLSNSKGRKDKLIHRLVAEIFIPNPHQYQTVNHIDEDKTNNNVTNLEWCSLSTNIQKYNNNHPMETRPALNNLNILNNSKPVYQCDKNTHEILQKFPSIRNAAKICHCSPSNILQVANGKRKTAAGYYWQFMNS